MAGAMSTVDFTLGLGRGEVPRAVSVILLEGDLTKLSTGIGPDGKTTDNVFTRAAPIIPGDLVKLNVLSSCESLETKGAICVEKADAAGDFAIGILINHEITFRETPSANVSGAVDSASEITALLNNKYYLVGTMWLYAMDVLDVEIDISGGAIIPGDAVAPSVGDVATGANVGYRWIYRIPGLSVADTGVYDDTGYADNSKTAVYIALNAGDADGDTIGVAVGLNPVLLLA